MRNQQKVDDEAEKWRDDCFDEIHPTPAKIWRRKEVDATVPIEITATPAPSEKEDINIDEAMEAASALEDDEEQVDFEDTPTRVGMDINMVYYLPTEFRAVDEEGEIAQLNLGPRIVFLRSQKNR